jgi:NAD(P)-dependent dehydrogenase (short-subunit alcohol dehydrogenase family)
LAGRVALVTGGGRGIGRAHALTLAREGATVVVNDLGTDLNGQGSDAGPAQAVAQEIVDAGGTAIPDTTDIASIEGGAAAVERTIEQCGRIDVVVNNAGFAHGGGDLGRPIDHEVDALMGVHFKAAVGTISACLGPMQSQRFGRVINMVSEASLDERFVAGFGYAAAKAALWSLTLVASRETGDGITVNAISPGARTRMNEQLLDASFRGGTSDGLDLDPMYVAAVAAFLASDEAVDITGRIIHAAGGVIREYTTRRTSQSDLVSRLEAALSR